MTLSEVLPRIVVGEPNAVRAVASMMGPLGGGLVTLRLDEARRQQDLWDVLPGMLELNPPLGPGLVWQALGDSMFEALVDLDVPAVAVVIPNLEPLARTRPRDCANFLDELCDVGGSLGSRSGGRRRVDFIALVGLSPRAHRRVARRVRRSL